MGWPAEDWISIYIFRLREHFGMDIPELGPQHKTQHLIRRHQLANSKDPRVRQIHIDFSEYQAGRDKHSVLRRATNEWKECVEMDKLLAEVKTNQIKRSAQTVRWPRICPLKAQTSCSIRPEEWTGADAASIL